MQKIVLACFIFMASCNASETESESADADTSKTVAAGNIKDPGGCYTWQSGQDSASLALEVNGNQVTGTLNYYLFEKDSNKGSIKGSIVDDMIVADYSFQSEGMTSVREVVFKIEDNNLVEGYGDIDVEGDTARFKNKTELEYTSDRPFVKKECK